MRMHRLFSILDKLRVRRQPVAATTLAEELGVSVRTIYRDMDMLRDLGAPIHGEGGVGYLMGKGYFLPPLSFDQDELDAIVLGARLAASQGDRSLSLAANRALGKIRAVLPRASQGAYLDAPLLVYSKKKQQSTGALRYLPRLRSAIRERQRVRFNYESLSGRSSKRTLCPLGLTVFDNAWVLTGWSEERAAFRNFRPDRIQKLKVLGTFYSQPGQKLDDYLATL